MLATALAVLAFQQGTVSVTAGSGQATTVKVHIVEGDSTRRDTTHKKLISATNEQIVSAFADPAARSLLDRARAERMRQDSSIISYDASPPQRLTIGLAFTKFG